MNFKVYQVSYFIFETVETSFNLDWSRPEADLRQDNLPPLKHFGSAPASESQIMNPSEHMEPFLYLIFLSRKNMADWLIFRSVNERAQCKKKCTLGLWNSSDHFDNKQFDLFYRAGLRFESV